MKIKKNSDLRNAKSIGITIENYLNEIGIFTLADLAETTSVEAFKRIRKNYPYSLEGTLLNLHWNDIPAKLKEELKVNV